MVDVARFSDRPGAVGATAALLFHDPRDVGRGVVAFGLSFSSATVSGRCARRFCSFVWISFFPSRRPFCTATRICFIPFFYILTNPFRIFFSPLCRSLSPILYLLLSWRSRIVSISHISTMMINISISPILHIFIEFGAVLLLPRTISFAFSTFLLGCLIGPIPLPRLVGTANWAYLRFSHDGPCRRLGQGGICVAITGAAR